MFGDEEVRAVVDKASYFYLDDPVTIDYDDLEGVYRLRAATHVIPDKFRL